MSEQAWTAADFQLTPRAGFAPPIPDSWWAQLPLSHVDLLRQQRDTQRVHASVNTRSRYTGWDWVCDDCRLLVRYGHPCRPPRRQLLDISLPQAFVCQQCQHIMYHTQIIRGCTTLSRCLCQSGPLSRLRLFHWLQGGSRQTEQERLVVIVQWRYQIITEAARIKRWEVLLGRQPVCDWFYIFCAAIQSLPAPAPCPVLSVWRVMGHTGSARTDQIACHASSRARPQVYLTTADGPLLDRRVLGRVLLYVTRGTVHWEQYVRRHNAVMPVLLRVANRVRSVAECIWDLYCSNEEFA